MLLYHSAIKWVGSNIYIYIVPVATMFAITGKESAYMLQVSKAQDSYHETAGSTAG